MNIIETVKSVLMEFPKINEVCNDIHVDFTDSQPTDYGLSSTGDSLIFTDILGNQIRQHTFVLYAVYQSQSDYERMNNSGVLLELSYWLENRDYGQRLETTVSGEKHSGYLEKIASSNGMLFAIPNGNLNDGMQYQLQIKANYILES